MPLASANLHFRGLRSGSRGSALRLRLWGAVVALVGASAAAGHSSHEPVDTFDPRVAAARGLGRLGPQAEEALPLLAEIIEDRHCDPELRSAAVRSAAAIGEDAAPGFEERLADRYEAAAIRVHAAAGLGTLGPGARKSVPTLLAVAARRNEILQVRLAAIAALAEMATAPQPAAAEDGDEDALPPPRQLPPEAQEQIAAALVSLVHCDEEPSEVRIAALETLAALGPAAVEVDEELLDCLADRCQDIEVRVAAARALRRVASPEAVASLAAVLGAGDDEAAVRIAAAEALAARGPVAEAPLRERLVDGSESIGVRAAAGRALSRCLSAEGEDDALTAARDILHDSRQPEAVRFAAAEVLGAEAIARLGRLLKDGTARFAVVERRTRAVEALGRMGPEAVPLLGDLAQDRGEYFPVRRTTLEVLREMGPKAEAVVPVLSRIAQDHWQEHSSLRILAIEALAAIGPAADAGPALLRVAGHPDEPTAVRVAALEALVAMDPDPAGAVPLLTAAVEDHAEKVAVRTAALAALGHMGAAAKESLPAVVRVAQNINESHELRGRAVETLGALGAVALPMLVRLLGGEGLDEALAADVVLADEAAEVLVSVAADRAEPGAVRVAAIEALEPFGDRGESFLREAVNDYYEDEAVRAAATRALPAVLGEAAVPLLGWRPASPYLSIELRVAAIEALGELGPAAESVLPTLRSIVEDGNADPARRAAAASAVVQIAPGEVEQLVRRLGDRYEEPALRRAVAESLAAMGCHARAALPVLVERMRSRGEVREVRLAAIGAAAAIAAGGEEPCPPAASTALEDAAEGAEAGGTSGEAEVGEALVGLVARRSEDVSVRTAAVEVLGGLGAETALSALVDRLTDAEEAVPVRAAAASALGQFASRTAGEALAARTAFDALAACLDDPRSGAEVREAAATALGQAGAQAASRLVSWVLDRSQPESLRAAAVRGLAAARSESGAVQAAAELGKLVDDPEETVAIRIAAAEALGPDTVPRLSRFLQDRRGHFNVVERRALVVEALGRMGAAAVPVLAEVIQDRQEFYAVRRTAVMALAEMEATARDAVPVLARVARDRNGEYSGMRALATEALGRIGPEAREVVPTMVRLLQDGSEPSVVRVHAARSLGRIGPPSSHPTEGGGAEESDPSRE